MRSGVGLDFSSQKRLLLCKYESILLMGTILWESRGTLHIHRRKHRAALAGFQEQLAAVKTGQQTINIDDTKQGALTVKSDARNGHFSETNPTKGATAPVLTRHIRSTFSGENDGGL